ncbi:MAG: YwaF family protein [Clostridia bacterium]|nr:YwaF family protein [Clostridia bacterium]
MPQVFGWQHLTYVAVFLVLAVASLYLIHRFCKSDFSKFIAIKVTAAILLVFIVWNRICIAISNDDWFYFIPNTFCGIASFAFAICALAFKKDNCTLHCMVYCGFIGGLITIIYPDFVSQNESFFYVNTISGLLHHSMALYLAVLMFMTKWITPSLKKWKYFPLGLCIMMTYGIFLLTAFDKFEADYDAMYIKEPLISGTILTWYFVGALILILHLIFLLCYTYIPKYINKQKQKKSAENG